MYVHANFQCMCMFVCLCACMCVCVQYVCIVCFCMYGMCACVVVAVHARVNKCNTEKSNIWLSVGRSFTNLIHLSYSDCQVRLQFAGEIRSGKQL